MKWLGWGCIGVALVLAYLAGAPEKKVRPSEPSFLDRYRGAA
jgi:hypothetical protein